MEWLNCNNACNLEDKVVESSSLKAAIYVLSYDDGLATTSSERGYREWRTTLDIYLCRCCGERRHEYWQKDALDDEASKAAAVEVTGS